MAPAEWDQIFEIFHAARERSADERVLLLDTACGENTVFRKAVEELLKHDEATTGFLGEPLFASQTGESCTTRIKAGQRFGRYVAVELIGRGGIGEVWSARDTDLDRPVALKFVSNEELVGLDVHQITHEAKTASSLNHPGIVTIYEVVHSESTFAIAMELVEGESLRELCGKPIRGPELAVISLHIAEALAAAHAGGVVHGDIKPENILLRRDNYVKVLDFGLARRVTTETIASGLPACGTLRYMSPEQACGEPLTPASDIFSFGLVLYELATGKHAFPSLSPLDAVEAMLTKEPSPPSSMNPAIQAHLDSLIRAMLAKEPMARPTAGHVAAELDQILATLNEPLVEARRTHAGQRSSWALALVVVLAISGAAVWFTKSKRDAGDLTDLTIKPLTSQPGWEWAPAVSPRGDAIAFTWTPTLDAPRQLYVKRDDDAEPLKLTASKTGHTGFLAWSPDGNHIAFKRQFEHGGAIYSIYSTGGAERKIVDLANGDLSSSIDWSPDGRLLAFADSSPTEGRPSIYLYDLETGNKRRITTPPSGIWGDWSPKFSPDGKTLAFKRVTGLWADDIYLVPANGGEMQRFTSLQRSIWEHAWMPDGKSLLVSCQCRGTVHGLWRFPLSAPADPERVIQSSIDTISPAIGRQSGKIAWVSRMSDLNIYRIAATGTAKPERLIASTGRDEHSAYAPDGRIAWTSDRSGSREIWIARQDGSGQKQITHLNGPAIAGLQWSFDGRYLAFDSRFQNRTDIFLVECSPGTLQCGKPYAMGVSPAHSPGWSADGRSIYFASDRSGRLQIWKRDLSGGTPVAITQIASTLPHESADGKWLYFFDVDRNYIVRKPGSKGDAQPKEIVPLVDAGRGVPYDAWTVTDNEVVFVARSAVDRPAAIRAYNLSTGKVRSVLNLTEVLITGGDIGLSVSRDGKSILFTQLDRSGSNIVIAEKSR